MSDKRGRGRPQKTYDTTPEQLQVVAEKMYAAPSVKPTVTRVDIAVTLLPAMEDYVSKGYMKRDALAMVNKECGTSFRHWGEVSRLASAGKKKNNQTQKRS